MGSPQFSDGLGLLERLSGKKYRCPSKRGLLLTYTLRYLVFGLRVSGFTWRTMGLNSSTKCYKYLRGQSQYRQA